MTVIDIVAEKEDIKPLLQPRFRTCIVIAIDY